MRAFLLSLMSLTLIFSLAACSTGGANLGGSTWSLRSLNGQPALEGITAGMIFGEDGSLTGKTGCNSFSTTYKTSGNQITISPAASTQMACPQPQMDQETAFYNALANAKTYNVQGTILNLIDASGTTVAAFDKVDAASISLPGSAWNVTGYNNGQQAVVSLVSGSEITAIFGENSILSGNTGCNDYNVRFQVDGRNVKVDQQVQMTENTCSEELMVQEQQYLAALQSAATYTIQLDTMEFRTADDALAVTFVR
jgi:heat shock protein HslJ